MSAKPLLVVGTTNRKKGRELAGLLAPAGLEIRSLAEFPDPLEVVEDGDTFAANAALKAAAQARHLGHWVLAEDSGLMVDGLGGRPGVFSARFAGPGATDEANNQRLLDELAAAAPATRTAQFVCHVAVADPSGRLRAECAAACRGRIVSAPRGTHGFGYDPLFEIVEYHRTFGQLGERVKSCLSHRARAVRRLLPQLIELRMKDEG
jgi:XTP/dITP diphosphohydrolase